MEALRGACLLRLTSPSGLEKRQSSVYPDEKLDFLGLDIGFQVMCGRVSLGLNIKVKLNYFFYFFYKFTYLFF